MIVHSAQDLALSTVVGADSQRAAHAAMKTLDDLAEGLGLAPKRGELTQSQDSKNIAAGTMGLAGMLAKMAFTSPEGIQVGAGGGKGSSFTLGG
ncbi:MAG: hypothetical protein ACKVOE_06035 [Rickettsiales bacterium]